MTNTPEEPTVHSAGEEGAASDGQPSPRADAEVLVGEIPDPDDLARMLWTARCTDPAHDLLGTVATRDEAAGLAAAHQQTHISTRNRDVDS